MGRGGVGKKIRPLRLTPLGRLKRIRRRRMKGEHRWNGTCVVLLVIRFGETIPCTVVGRGGTAIPDATARPRRRVTFGVWASGRSDRQNGGNIPAWG